MGYAGGVECQALAGHHLCEADTYCEIVDPQSGNVKAPGEQGEIVITTLTRTAMPLIRYRTGYTSTLLTDACPCGSVLRRMDRVRPLAHGVVRLRSGDRLNIADMDEVIFPLADVVNYFATVTTSHEVDRLSITLYPGSNGSRPATQDVSSALRKVAAIGNAIQEGCLVLEPVRYTNDNRVTTCAIKRTIVHRSEEE
jgi:phenylacetate-coenzyme A ligase PaaK-like adenylate-forming protein